MGTGTVQLLWARNPGGKGWVGLLWVSSVDFPASHPKAASAGSLGEEPEYRLPALPLGCVHPANAKGAAAAAGKSLQSCPTLCDPIDGSPPGSPVPGLLQARMLGWVASANWC